MMAHSSNTRVALLFPGQGAQYVGMGRALYDHSATAARVLDEADDALGGGFLSVLFEGPFDALTATNVSQPAIYAVSYAAYCVLRETCPDITIAAAAGLSLGEYSALTAAGCLPFETGVTLVRRRGEFMQQAAEAHPGAMASVLGLDAEAVDGACSGVDDVYVANYNCPGQIVISGSAAGVEQASAACNDAGARKVIQLKVSGAFHSPFMASARTRLQPLLDAVEWAAPEFPVLSNVRGLPYTDTEAMPALLGRQVVESVRWEDDCRWMLAQGVEHFLEIGPGKVLQGLMKKIERAAQVSSAEAPDQIAAACAASEE